MIQGRKTPLDYLFFLRPVLLPPVWTIALLGTVRQEMPHLMSPWMWLGFFLHLSCLFGGVYTLNQICDVESDRLNKKLYFLPEGIIPINAAWRFTIILDVSALMLSVLFGWLYLAFTVLIVALGIMYSAGPFPWKNHPWLGLIANAMGHGTVVFLFGYLVTGCPVIESWKPALAYTLAVGAVYLVTTAPDRAGDSQTGKMTASVKWGVRMTLVFAAMLVTLAAVIAAWSGDRFLATSAIVAWPFFASAAYRPSFATLAAKAAVGALSIAAILAYPLYAILLVAGFFGTRIFFRWRFGICYPTFV